MFTFDVVGRPAVAEWVVITRDLMDASRFRSVAPGVAIVRSATDDALCDATVVLVDLTLGIDLASIVTEGRTVIAYGPHVDDGALVAAKEAGCADALARSVVFRRAAELLH